MSYSALNFYGKLNQNKIGNNNNENFHEENDNYILYTGRHLPAHK